MSLIRCSFSGATGGVTAVMYWSIKAKTTSSRSLSILEHLLPTASNGHEVIFSSGTLFLSHNLLYGLVGMYHWECIQRRMPQLYVETFTHQLWGFGISICFCLQCSFSVHLFVIISSQTVQLLLESSQASISQQQTMLGTIWGYFRFGALLVHHITDLANKQVIL